MSNIGDYEATRANFDRQTPAGINFGRDDVVDRWAAQDKPAMIRLACVVVGKDYEPSDALAKDIQDYCKARTAPYKYPCLIEFTADLTKTTSGKIRRVELRRRETASA